MVWGVLPGIFLLLVHVSTKASFHLFSFWALPSWSLSFLVRGDYLLVTVKLNILFGNSGLQLALALANKMHQFAALTLLGVWKNQCLVWIGYQADEQEKTLLRAVPQLCGRALLASVGSALP